jgi:ankyrin repeat protein
MRQCRGVEICTGKWARGPTREDKLLEYAASEGYSKVVQLLADRGAVQISRKSEALELAARDGHESCVKILLDSDSDVSGYLGATWNKTFVMENIAKRGHVRKLKLLVESGWDLQAKRITGMIRASTGKKL